MKRIVIRLTPRDIKDSPQLLHDVADAFAELIKDADDVVVDLTDRSTLPTAEVIPIPLNEEKAGVDVAKTTLDLEDRAIREGDAEPPTPEAAKGGVRLFMEKLGKVGGNAAVSVLIREAIEMGLDMFK